MKKLMVDCETLGIGERPVLLSIGAVVFDDAEIHKFLKQGGLFTRSDLIANSLL